MLFFIYIVQLIRAYYANRAPAIRSGRPALPMPPLAILIFWLAGSIVLQPLACRAQQQRDPQNPQGKWEVLSGCKLVDQAVLDGDSFHVLHQSREYIFRLYFVDAPETDESLADRAEDQAAYFGIRAADVSRAGELATKFTRAKLSARPFTVVTRWENAMGRSKLVRFYAVVLVNGQNLAEELVAQGLARIHGARALWPDGPRSTTFISKLKHAELMAREQRRGIWNERAFPPNGSAPAVSSSNGTSASRPSSPQIDINRAGAAELQTLPGIGPKLARSIIAHRPFKSVGELDRVPGIGPKTIDRLRPLVRVEKAGR